ncbi:MAG: Nramp family divalent metal transporter [Pirellulales bacterium]|nr:Nramp family divalent metal transporter [Pirellulales bacterium]
MRKLPLLFGLLGPGILVAATGVGAGDLVTASLAGSRLGLALLWAAWVGSVLKWYLNEGIARWQMATETTLLEGWVEKLGRWVQWLFIAYLAVWSLFVAGAIMSAIGVATVGLFGLEDHPSATALGKIFGNVFSLVGIVLVLVGGFRVFEVVMSACIGVMFIAVVSTSLLLPETDWSGIARGLIPGQIPEFSGVGLKWLIGVLGGVGGTVTLLSYGYWIRERGRRGEAGLRACRIDLTVGYAMTAIFGIAMMIVASRIELPNDTKGTRVLVQLAKELESLFTGGRLVFLIGAWGAIFSSLLGVWQSVPYLFADFLSLCRGQKPEERRAIDFDRTKAYRIYLLAIGIVPAPLIWFYSLADVQLAYTTLGAASMPLLALTLLLLNTRKTFVGERYRNNWATNVILVLTLAAFLFFGGYQIWEKLKGSS